MGTRWQRSAQENKVTHTSMVKTAGSMMYHDTHVSGDRPLSLEDAADKYILTQRSRLVRLLSNHVKMRRDGRHCTNAFNDIRDAIKCHPKR